MRFKEVKCLVHYFIVSKEAKPELELNSLHVSKFLIPRFQIGNFHQPHRRARKYRFVGEALVVE